MDKIQIKNVRSLSDTGLVSLSKVNLLVGENSSGKSTFLRTFPLIKQSLGKRTNGPILWAGDVDDYVDFGSFNEAVTNDGSTEMTFSFQFKLSILPLLRTGRLPQLAGKILRHRQQKKAPILYSITLKQAGSTEYVSSLRVNINKLAFEFEFDPKYPIGVVKVNGKPIFETQNKYQARMIHRIEAFDDSIFGFDLPNIEELIDRMRKVFTEEKPADEGSQFLIFQLENSVEEVASSIGALLCEGMDFDYIKEQLKGITASGSLDSQVETAIQKLSDMGESDQDNIFLVIYFYRFFPRIEDYIRYYFRQTHYIAPLRATAERYYRLRNLAIDEVDYQGKNLAIFLNGLTWDRLQSFQEWTLKHFGFQTIVDRTEGHVSLKVVLQSGGSPINMSDTGFGYSQILPIITQLWDLSTTEELRARETVPLVIAIEQPELHLHPALQAKLVDAFIASIELAESNHNQVQLILETHSETIVNYFGRMIAKGRLKSNDVSVLLFDRDTETKKTEVKTSHYDKHGYLQNWPIGFFAP